MKKVIAVVLVLSAVAAVAFFALKKTVFHHPQAAELVPAGTVFFAQLPDLGTSARRLQETALWKIFQEPEMQPFLEKPRQQSAPVMTRAEGVLTRIQRVQPREVFAAITSIEKTIPTMLAGFAFSGKQAEAETLVAEWRADLRKNWPTGKADLTTYGTHEIQTFGTAETTVAEAFRDGWYFVANDLELLKQTLDRADGKGDAKTALINSETYVAMRKHLPKEPDAMVAAQLATVTERIASLLVAAGSMAPAQVEEVRKSKGFAAATQFDGARSRDTIFALREGGAEEPPLAQHALALTSAQTLVYQSSVLPVKVEIPAQTSAMFALIPGYAAFQKALTDRGLSIEDFTGAFGPENGLVVDWLDGAPSPSVLIALDVRDRAKAAAFFEVIGSGVFGGAPWAMQEKDGITRLSPPPAEGLSFITPALALTENLAIAALSADALEKALATLPQGGAHLGEVSGFKEAAASVVKPTSTFGYVDLRGLFERSYGVFKPFLAMSLAFSPDAGKYVDAGKLPPAEAISRHLGALVYSQAKTKEGMLLESTGPITLTQLMFGLGAAVVPTALPAMEAALSGGALLDPTQALKGLLNAPPATDLADPSQPAPDVAPTPAPETPPPATPPAPDPKPASPDTLEVQ